jgi:hypothetical protein
MQFYVRSFKQERLSPSTTPALLPVGVRELRNVALYKPTSWNLIFGFFTSLIKFDLYLLGCVPPPKMNP